MRPEEQELKLMAAEMSANVTFFMIFLLLFF